MLLTIDIGTSVFKAALWDYDGKRLSFASEPLFVINDAGAHEAECAQWLRAMENCCGKLGNLSSVEVIIISGNGPSLVPVLSEPSIDDGTHGFRVEAHNARLYLDRRAISYSEEVSALMGGYVDASFFLPKILQIKNEEPALYDKTKYFLGAPEYLAFALTGEARTVFPSDGFGRWFWDDDALGKLKLDKAKMPPFIRPADPFGTISDAASDFLGLSKKIPVVSGGPDFFAAILGSGVTEPRQVCDRSGSSEGINLCTKEKIDDKRFMAYGHPVKPLWNLSGVINTTGKAIQWCREILQIPDYEDFFSLAAKSRVGSGSLVFLPFLAGERSPLQDTKAHGIWQGLNLSTTREDMANSVLEGIGFAIRDIISAMEESGAAARQLRLTGALAGNAYLNRIKADITGLPALEPVYKETELLGLAIIGCCFKGKFASFSEAGAKMVQIEREFEPNKTNFNVYNENFYLYKGKKGL
jgi:xylulokinase